MYTLYAEGEEIATFETPEAVRAEVELLRKDYAKDEAYDMDRWPTDYDPGYTAGDGFRQHFLDVYDIKQDVPAEQFL